MNDKYDKIVGRNISVARVEKGLTQAELADLVGLDLSTVKSLESGQRPNLRTYKSQVIQIAEALGVETVVMVFDNLEIRQTIVAAAKDEEDFLDDLVHETASHRASDANNGGASAQLDYLIKNGWTYDGIADRLGISISQPQEA